MNARRLLVVLAIIVPVLVWVYPAAAVTITFLEPISDAGNVSATTDIANATIASTPESASVSVGNVSGTGTVIAKIALIGPNTPGHEEGGGQGVSDVVTLLRFSSDDVVAGFQATFQSDASASETGIPTPTGLTAPNIIETGLPVLVFSGSLVLPGSNTPVSLTVNAQSDRDAVPEPSTLLFLGSGLLGLAGTVAWRAHRRN
jgi:PEP-CTERM motif-containing protein